MHFYHEHKPGKGHAFNRACGRSSGNNCDKTTAVIRKFKLRFTFTKKLLRIMQLTAIILLWACMAVSARGNTQTISISARDASLQNVLKEVQKQSGYHIFYSYELVRQQGKVSVHVKNASLQQALDECFRGTNLTYTIIEKTIVVKQKEEKPASSAEALAKADQPPIDISGRVTDADGNPLVGASVKVKGSSLGTTTNNDGVFVLKGVNENATLEISFVGYETYTVEVANKTSIIASLKLKPESLNEVIINKGYYTEKQRYSVSNVGKVTARDIEKQPANNPILALQGRVPGLLVTQENGLPGGAITVRIQGKNSLNSGNVPLYVVDGVPYYSQIPWAGSEGVLGDVGDDRPQGTGNVTYGNALAFINPSDIESIEILKDAEATALYGSRAANGAILITTKKATGGRIKLDVTVQQGWSHITRYLKVLDRRQYLDMRYEAYKNDGIDFRTQVPGSSNNDLLVWDTTRSTNWQDYFLGGTGKYNHFNVTMSGGTNNSSYLVTGTYNRTVTVFPGDFSDQKLSFMVKLNNMSTNRKFKSEVSANFLADDNRLPGIDPTASANRLEPVAPSLFNADGSVNWAPNATGASTWRNPIVPIFFQTYKGLTKNLISSVKLSYSISNGLEIKTNVGYTFLVGNNFSGTPINAIRPEDRLSLQRSAVYGDKQVSSWIAEPQITYNRVFKRSAVDVVLGTSFQKSNATAQTIQAKGFPSDQVLEDFKAALTLESIGSSISEYKYNAFFGRIGYIYADKYILSASARRDGSSRYGRNNLFHNFGALGFGWVFSNEPFISKNITFLSFGKIKGTYGSTGNDQIGDYTFLSLYEYIGAEIGYQNTATLGPVQISNPYLQWEETKKLQIGLDLGFLDDRIVLNSSWSRNRSSNQIISYTLPSTTGTSSVLKNFPAVMQNSSIEFSLTSINIKNANFSWNSSFNLTFPTNKIISFPGVEKTTFSNSIIIGQPLGITKAYKFLGVNPANGEYAFADNTGNPTMSPVFLRDATLLINTRPKFYGGFENSFSYKALEFSAFFQYVSKTSRNNYYNNGSSISPGRFLGGSTGTSNQPVTVLNRWVKPGDIATVRRFSTSSAASTQMGWVQSSDAGLTDGSFIRLKNIAISYNLPVRWVAKSLQARIFFQGQNILTITKYPGQDPESGNATALPPLKIYALGFQLLL